VKNNAKKAKKSRFSAKRKTINAINARGEYCRTRGEYL